MEKPSTDEVYKQYIQPLSVAERLRLIELTVHDLAVSTPTQEQAERPSWMSVRGIAPNLLGGEDAQEWISRSRHEADVHRKI
jgi:hypothetical protein